MTSHADSIESMELLAASWRAFALDRNPGAQVRDLPGIAVRWAENRSPFWRCLTLTESEVAPEPLARRLHQAAVDIDVHAYGVPPEDGREGLSGFALQTNVVHAHLGLHDGTPVTCAATRKEVTEAGTPVYPRIGFEPNSSVSFFPLKS